MTNLPDLVTLFQNTIQIKFYKNLIILNYPLCLKTKLFNYLTLVSRYAVLLTLENYDFYVLKLFRTVFKIFKTKAFAKLRKYFHLLLERNNVSFCITCLNCLLMK